MKKRHRVGLQRGPVSVTVRSDKLGPAPWHLDVLDPSGERHRGELRAGSGGQATVVIDGTPYSPADLGDHDLDVFGTLRDRMFARRSGYKVNRVGGTP